MTETNQISLAWARQKLNGFAKMEQDVQQTRNDEQRYKDQPGYVSDKKAYEV